MAGLGKKSNPERGFFITFEGPEGAGKSTQIKLLRESLLKTRPPESVVVTREPGGTGLAEQIRDMVKHHQGDEPMRDETELLLFAASRAQHVRTLIEPSLKTGKIVLCDRFYDSTTAYQGYARGFDMGFVAALNKFASCGITPDLTFLLDITPEKGMARARERNPDLFAGDRLENENMDFHRRVRAGFLEIAAREPERVVTLDAEADPASTHKKIMEAAHGRIGVL